MKVVIPLKESNLRKSMVAIDAYGTALGGVHGTFDTIDSNKCLVFAMVFLKKSHHHAIHKMINVW